MAESKLEYFLRKIPDSELGLLQGQLQASARQGEKVVEKLLELLQSNSMDKEEFQGNRPQASD